MRVIHGRNLRPSHLTYCTNIHPGESLSQVMHSLTHHTAVVARDVSPDAPFGVGLRLSAAAMNEARDPVQRAALKQLLSEHRLYVFTLNGFPYGTFHGARVKEAVYRPDWRTDERLNYTLGLAELLADLLPDNLGGSISTVPGGFRKDIATEADRQQVAARLITTAIEMHRLHARTGKEVAIAIEPEPDCQIETLHEAITFFEDHLLSADAITRVARETSVGRAGADALLRRHLGVCLDTCHAAVEYESITNAVTALHAAGVGVKKMQLSNALRVVNVDAHAIELLRKFNDDVYLHQVVQRSGQGLIRFLDLPDAIMAFSRQPQPGVEWRVHFHIPLFAEPDAPLSSTRDVLLDALAEQQRRPFTEHLEVETYTWDVLPSALRTGDVNTSIARELRFSMDALQSSQSSRVIT